MSSSSSAAPIPWLSLAAVALCMSASLWAGGRSEDGRGQIESSLAAARDYHLAHPHTRPTALLAEFMGVEPTPAKLDSGWEGLARRRQTQLDALLAPAEAALAALPEQRFALRVEAPGALGLFAHSVFHLRDSRLLLACLVLLALGLVVEPTLGRAGYALTLLGGSLGAGLGYLQAAPLDAAPLLGSSGALAGAIAGHAVRNGREATQGGQPLVLLFALTSVLGPALADGTWLLAPPVLGEPRPLGLEVTGLTLFGGMAGGVVGMWLAAAAGLLPRATRNPQTADRSVRRALQARAAGRDREAFELLSKVIEQRPDDADAVSALWDVAGSLGRRRLVRDAMLRLVREQARRGDLEAAGITWLDVTESGMPEGAEPALLVKLAEQLRRMERPDAAIAALDAALSRRGGSEPMLATRVARLAETLDREIAERAAWAALSSPELALSDRQGLEEVLEKVSEPVSDWAQRRRAARSQDVNPAMKPPIDIELSERRAEVLVAEPVRLSGDELVIELGGRERPLALNRVQAVAVAAVQNLGERAVVVVDLVLNWTATSDESLRIVRLRSDGFDPRSVVPGDHSPADALRRFLGQLLSHSRATPLPDEASALGRPFVTYATVEDYQRTVLMVDDLSNGPVS